MTNLQKTIFRELLKGGNIAIYPEQYRLRAKDYKPVVSFHETTFMNINHLLRKEEKPHRLLVLDRWAVRSLSRRYWAKKEYVKQMKSRS